MDDDLRILRAEYEIGQAADAFWHSELGKYILGCAEQDTDAAMAKYKDVDPEDAKSIRELQNEVDGPARALNWLNGAIIRGRESLHNLEQMADAETD